MVKLGYAAEGDIKGRRGGLDWMESRKKVAYSGKDREGMVAELDGWCRDKRDRYYK